MIKFNDPAKLPWNAPTWWQYNLFWWKVEGYEALNGLNVYQLKDPRSAGFILKFGQLSLRIRYSKYTKQWHFGFKTKEQI